MCPQTLPVSVQGKGRVQTKPDYTTPIDCMMAKMLKKLSDIFNRKKKNEFEKVCDKELSKLGLFMGNYNYACPIGMTEYGEVVKAVNKSDLAAKWEKFAISLRIEQFRVNIIARDNSQCERCLHKILECWIKGENYDYEVCL